MSVKVHNIIPILEGTYRVSVNGEKRVKYLLSRYDEMHCYWFY